MRNMLMVEMIGIFVAAGHGVGAAQPVGVTEVPLLYVENVGQDIGGVRYLVKAPGLRVSFLDHGAVFTTERGSLSLEFVGANRSVSVEAVERLPGLVNFLIGRDPESWMRICRHIVGCGTAIYMRVSTRYSPAPAGG